MTRSACLAAASALALATVLNVGIADAQNVGQAGQRALRLVPVGPVLGQSGSLRAAFASTVQDVSLDEAGAAGASTAKRLSGGQKLAKVEVEGEVKAIKLDASPAAEQKPPVDTKPNDVPAVAKIVTKNVGVQPAAEAKPDQPVEPPRAVAQQQPAAQGKLEQQPAVQNKAEQQPAAPPGAVAQQQPAAQGKVEQQPAPSKAKEAPVQAAPVNSAPSIDRARVADQPVKAQAADSSAFTPRQPRNFSYGGYGGYSGSGSYGGYGNYDGYDRRPTDDQHCEH